MEALHLGMVLINIIYQHQQKIQRSRRVIRLQTLVLPTNPTRNLEGSIIKDQEKINNLY